MKNYILVIILVGISFKMSSQDLCGNIEYTYTKNLAYLYIEKYEMKFDNFKSQSIEYDIKTKESLKEKEYSNEGLTIKNFKGRNNKTPKFFFQTTKETYFTDIWDNNQFLVKENPFLWKWKLINEKKTIGSFICKKASIKFRGREYIAWYTMDIPVSFGPWKFKGLPGLILEVYDTEKVFHIIPTQVKINKDLSCDFNINKKELENSITVSQYLKEKKLLLEKEIAKMSSKLSKGSKPLKLDNNCNSCTNTIEIFNEKN